MKTVRDRDLWLIDILTALLIVIIVLLPSNALRIVIGLPLVFFFPGYILIAALFPRKESLGGVERVALSFGMSIVVVPLIGLILNYMPWGIRLYPVLISLAAFILIMSAIAWRRRRKLPAAERFTISLSFKLPSWEERGVLDMVLSVVLVVAMVGAIATLVYAIATPKVGERFTEFYILGEEEKATGYPTELSLGERGEVILGVVNHEQEEVDYQVRVRINGAAGTVKAWLKEGGSLVELPDNTLIMEGLLHEEKWQGRIIFEPLFRGEKQKLEFLLFSSLMREDYSLSANLDSGNFFALEINEAEGWATASLNNESGAAHSYGIEVWQNGALHKEVGFTVLEGNEIEEKFSFPPDKSIFLVYEDGELVIEDSGAELSLHLWLDVD